MSQTVRKITLSVQSVVKLRADDGTIETKKLNAQRQAQATSKVTFYTQDVKDKKTKRTRQETVGEAIYRVITDMENPMYSIGEVVDTSFDPAC